MLKLESFEDPITCELMNEPVILVRCGHTYNKSTVDELIARRVLSCPQCQTPFRAGPGEVRRNYALQLLFEEFVSNLNSFSACVKIEEKDDDDDDEEEELQVELEQDEKKTDNDQDNNEKKETQQNFSDQKNERSQSICDQTVSSSSSSSSPSSSSSSIFQRRKSRALENIQLFLSRINFDRSTILGTNQTGSSESEEDDLAEMKAKLMMLTPLSSTSNRKKNQCFRLLYSINSGKSSKSSRNPSPSSSPASSSSSSSSPSTTTTTTTRTFSSTIQRNNADAEFVESIANWMRNVTWFLILLTTLFCVSYSFGPDETRHVLRTFLFWSCQAIAHAAAVWKRILAHTAEHAFRIALRLAVAAWAVWVRAFELSLVVADFLRQRIVSYFFLSH